ncbi:MAG: helix-turn-helix domain-containing protein [Candidatus Micrarchaeaceae archaeon]
MTIHEILGKNIRKQRKKLGLTQEALAAKSHFSSNYIACVERAQEKLTLDGLVRVASALHIAPHLLLIPESYKRE